MWPSATERSISVSGAVVPMAGGDRCSQAYDREAISSCASATFNLSNGVSALSLAQKSEACASAFGGHFPVVFDEAVLGAFAPSSASNRSGRSALARARGRARRGGCRGKLQNR